VDEAIERAAVAVAGVLDRPVFGFGDAELCAGLRSLEDVVTLARSAQAVVLWELTRRDIGLRGATSVANGVRDRLRVSSQAGQRMVALGKILNTRPVLRHNVATYRSRERAATDASAE
jgi:hypothetical protein